MKRNALSVVTSLMIDWCGVVFQLQFALAFSTRRRHSASSLQQTRSLRTTIQSLAAISNADLQTIPSLFIIDVDNVRGKSNFQWTHEGLLESATEWRRITATTDTILALVVDHGILPSLYTGGPLDDRVGVFFSGTQKADDVIVSLVQESFTKTTVVTADQELKSRCRQVSSQHTQLDFMEPMTFLSEIEALSTQEYTLNFVTDIDSPARSDNNNNNVVENAGDSIRREVALRQELQMLNRLLHPRGTRSNGKKRQVSKKQRTKLVARRDRARERLQELLEFEESNTLSSVLDSNSNISTLNGAVQSMAKNCVPTYFAESTYERRLLAERLRRRLDRAGSLSFPMDDESLLPKMNEILRNAKSDRVTFVNGEPQSLNNDECDTLNRDGRSLASSVLTVPRRFFNEHQVDGVPSTLLRIVTISDTHGYEHELLAHCTGGESPRLLPAADVLIHCGDFSESGSRKIKMQAKARLDAFLAAQTHIPTKIVLRGNHDPHTPGRVLFPRSKALYVTKPMTMTLQHNVTLGLRPFSRRGTILLLPPCDILASHEPPFGILDMTYQRIRAGSMTLRRAVESSSHKPALWLAGHIHEGRGSVLHTFVDEYSSISAASTLVVNGANANAGRANRIVTGPVLVDVVKDMSLVANASAWTTGANADTSPVKLVRSDSIQHMASSEASSTSELVDKRRLLAVDLGLRTATVVLDGKGDILDVEDWRFTDHPQLEKALQGLLHNHSITHVVVEGNDVKLIQNMAKGRRKVPSRLAVCTNYR